MVCFSGLFGCMPLVMPLVSAIWATDDLRRVSGKGERIEEILEASRSLRFIDLFELWLLYPPNRYRCTRLLSGVYSSTAAELK